MGGDSLGLSIGHKRAFCESYVALGGDLVGVRWKGLKACGGGQRGVISGFTVKSRRRLLRVFASLDRRKLELPLFVTLTYPDEFPGFRGVQRDLRTFFERLERKHPACFAIWKKEVKGRKSGENVGKLAMHVHLEVFGVPFLDKDWLSKTWFEIVGSGDERHLRAGTQVQKVEDWGKARGYLSKYLAKVDEEKLVDSETGECLETGRMWGIFGRERMPVSLDVRPLEGDESVDFSRVLRRYLRSKGVKVRAGCYQGVSAFMDWSAGVRLREFLGVS